MVGIKYIFSILLLTTLIYASENKPLNYKLRNQQHPVTNVQFNRFGYPIFESKFNCRLPFHLLHASDQKQFKYCTNKLREAIKKDKGLKKQFSKKQLQEINLKKPNINKFTWHHHQAKSKQLLQLVNRAVHNSTAHSGGRSIYGGGKLGRLGKISNFTHSSVIYKTNNLNNYKKIAKQIHPKAIVVPATIIKSNTLVASVKNSAYTGLAIFAIEGGTAYYDFLKGNIYSSKFKQKVMESAIKGITVGATEGLILFLLPSPHGLIIIGAGVGAYILVDTTINRYQYYKEKHLLNADDLAVYGIKVDSILDLDDDNVPLNINRW